MRKIVDVHAVIIFFYALFSKKVPITEDLRLTANKMITKCNDRIEKKLDKFMSDKLKVLSSLSDFDLWKRAFELAFRNLSWHGVVSKEMFHGFLTRENYIKGSLRYYLSESRYYAREQKTFLVIVEYLQYLQLTEVSEITQNALF